MSMGHVCWEYRNRHDATCHSVQLLFGFPSVLCYISCFMLTLTSCLVSGPSLPALICFLSVWLPGVLMFYTWISSSPRLSSVCVFSPLCRFVFVPLWQHSSLSLNYPWVLCDFWPVASFWPRCLITCLPTLAWLKDFWLPWEHVCANSPRSC